MVGLTELAPNPFGGFAPFPNSIMIPFMATQSAVLGYNFGIGYEIGKRTIKSLDNDFFNKIRAGSTDIISVVTDGKEIKMQYNEYVSFITKRHGHEQIAIFESMIPNFMKLQDTIIEKSVDIELKKAARTPSAMVEIIQAFAAAGGEVIVDKLDKASDTERNFIMTTVPILGLIYAMTKYGGGKPFIPPHLKEPEPPDLPSGGFPLEHTSIIGHEQHPFHSVQEPPQTTPDLNFPPPTTPEGKEPEPAEQKRTFTFTFSFFTSGGEIKHQFKESHTQFEWKKIVAFWDEQVQSLQKTSQSNNIKSAISMLSNLRIAYKNNYGVWI